MDKNEIIKAVKNAQQGDNEAFEQLFNSYSKSVYFSAYKIIGNEQSAQDVTQEVFTAIYFGIKNLKNPAAFYSWIMRITAFQCGHYLRSRKDVLLPSADLDENSEYYISESSDDLPEERLENSASRSIISEIIDTLPNEQRSVVVLYYFNELSVREIAKCLDVSESAVKSRLQYARQKIKQEVLNTERKSGIRLHSFGGAIAAALANESGLSNVRLPVSVLNTISASGASYAAATMSAFGGAAVTASSMVSAGITAKVVGIITAATVFCAGGTAVAVPVARELTSQVSIVEIKLNDVYLQPSQSVKADFALTVLINGQAETLTYSAGKGYTSSVKFNEATTNKLDDISFKLEADEDAVVIKELAIQAVKNGKSKLTLTADLNNETIFANAYAHVETEVTGINATDSLTLTVGERTNINAEVIPETASDKSIFYTSLNSDIATVNDKGEVMAIKAGTTKIRAVCGDFLSVSEVIVTLKPESLELSAKSTLIIGEATDISFVIKPEGCEGEISFTSDNEAVVAVDQNGKVTAVSEGSATVTAVLVGHEVKEQIKLTVKAKQTTSKPTQQPTQQPGTSQATPPPSQDTPFGEQHYHGNGKDFGHCPVCGIVYNQTNIPPTEGEHIHNWVYVKSTEPDCMGWGVDILVCECETVTFPIKYPPTAHNFGDWEQKTAPTSTEPGLRSRFCAQCLLEESETIAPTG